MTSWRSQVRVQQTARALMLGLVVATGAGCQSLPALFGKAAEELPQARAGSLAALTAVRPPAAPVPGSAADQAGSQGQPVSLDTVIESYRALLPLVDDPAKRVSIRHRLADLEFMRAERTLVDTAEDELSDSITAYEALLAEHPNRAGNDQIHYQLARAWELRGEPEPQLAALDNLVEGYPESQYWIEAQFRRADLLFVGGRYPEAEQAFDQVTGISEERGADPSLLMNAYYMRGWSQFKQNNYAQALVSYLDVLDLAMPAGQPVAAVEQRNRTLIEDLFRVFGLSLSYLDGADTLQALFRQNGGRPYEILLYDRYSELLLEREQYSDAVRVFEAYIEAHPGSRWAPRYHLNVIRTLEIAGFEKTIPARKAAFVSDYGLYSDYWAQTDAETEQFIRQELEQLLPELADRHYLLAAASDSRDQARGHFRQAAAYYAEFAATFPDHPRTPERLFLLAETYLELQDWAAAIDVFEQVAYDFPYQGAPPERAAEAGYASVLAFREYAKTWSAKPEPEVQAYRDLQQLNRLRFVNAFPADARAQDVFYLALQREFELQNWDQVVAMAARLVSWQPEPPPELATEALLLSGHGLFELARYPEAEQSYRGALGLMPASDPRYPGVRENLAATVYRQAEVLAAAGEEGRAIEEYLRVGLVVPVSELRANAEYDAASLLIGLARWERVVEVLTGFRGRFPEHPLIDTVPAKLALAYRETGQWEQAGDELRRMVALASTDEERRENLLIAAELYDQAGNTDKAIDTWRRYANTYAEPADLYMEAAHRLAELYQARNDGQRRDYWLRKQMAVVDQASSVEDDRMRYLAAAASVTLARDALARYDGIQLTLPLAQSMTAKTAALEQAVTAYQKTASYGLAEFATEAGYQIAHIYARLGADLMASERPPGLSELELAQYELLLEEQAYPFEDNAIDIHEQNTRRAREGVYDQWVKRSYEALQRLLPGRYNKQEITSGVVNELG